MSPTKPLIPDWLANASYEDLFLDDGSPERAQSHAIMLGAVVASIDVSPKLRVLAHELLIEAGREPDSSLANVYCLTLPETFPHNAWGMPGHYTERLGKTVVAFGKAALPCLVNLFGDQRPLGYFGSEEPTLSEEMQYRVSDLAAYLASLIVGTPYDDTPNAETRNGFIRQLMRELPG